MCITRVGRIVFVKDGRATVVFFDGRTSSNVDVSMVDASPGAFVEVYGNLALDLLTGREASSRRSAWNRIRRYSVEVVR